MAIKLSPLTLAVTLTSVILAAGSWFLVAPALTQVVSQRANLAALNGADMDTAKTKPSSLDQLRLQQEKEQAEILLPSTDGQYDTMIQIEALAKGLGLTLVSLAATPSDVTVGQKTAAAAGGGAMKKLNITLSTSAKYEDIQRFIQGLGTLNRFIQVTQFNLSGGGSSAATPASGSSANSAASDALTAQISAEAYYLPSAAAPLAK
jgi:Tfp pilus assembly protein PilO